MKWGCHCAYANENSVSCNQIVTSQCGASFKQKSPKINIFRVNWFLVEGPWERGNKVAIGLRIYKSVEMIYKKKEEYFRLPCVMH